MDVKKLFGDLSGLVECTICFEVFEDPRKLNCDHYFCLKCLRGIKQINKRLPCPTCRAETAIENGNVETLRKAFYVNRLIDVFTIKHYKDAPINCDTCKKKTSEATYCFDCGDFLCSECLRAHRIVKLTRDHRVLPLADFGEADYQNVLERPEHCPVDAHKDELMKYYCLVCQVPVCQSCVTVKHSGHNFEEIGETFKKTKAAITDKIQKLKFKLEEVTDAKENMRKEKDLIEQQRLGVEEQLDGTLRQMEECFRRLKQRSNNAAANACKNIQDQIDRARAREEDVGKVIGEMTAALSMVASQLGPDMNTEHDNKVKTVCDPPVEGAKRARISYQPSPELVHIFFLIIYLFLFINFAFETTIVTPTAPLNCTTEGAERLVRGIPATITVVTRDSQGAVVYCPSDKIAVEVKARITEDVSATGRYEFTFTPTAVTDYEISVTVNGETIQNSPFHVKATERQFRSVKVFGKKGDLPGKLNGPCGLSIDKDGNIAVGEWNNHRVQVFNSDGEIVVPPFGMDMLSRPDSLLHLNNPDGHVLVSDHMKNAVQMFTATGEFVKTFCKAGAANGEVKRPLGLSLDDNGNVIVCDWGNKRIQVMSLQGEFIRVLFGEEEGIRPCFCVYHQGHYYVTADGGEGSVMVFNKSGKRVQEFRDKDGGLHVLNPRGLVVDKNGHVIVCSGHRLHVYDKGILIKTIGSRGSNPGQFYGPWDVKLLPDGRIVVSDAGNDRIQILE